MSKSGLENPQSEEESDMQLIKVEIFDVHASSTILKVFPNTFTSYVCDAIANKIDLSSDQVKFYNLILIVSWVNEINNQRYSYVRTLKQSELVLSVYQSVINKQQEKCPIPNSSPNRKNKYLPTTNSFPSTSPSTSMLNELKTDRIPFNYQRHNISTRWFYKDMRTTPLDCTTHKDDISANSSSSEDEEEISTEDFSYLSQFERKGYLLRRSRKDPNVWRKRFCVLVDHLWCIDYPDIQNSIEQNNSNNSNNNNSEKRPRSITRRKKPKAMCLKIGRHFRVYDSVQGFNYPNCVALQLQSTGSSQNIVFLRANSTSEQQVWISDIQKRSMINSENQSIAMAEMIMCDEISMQEDKLARSVIPYIERIFEFPTDDSVLKKLHLSDVIHNIRSNSNYGNQNSQNNNNINSVSRNMIGRLEINGITENMSDSASDQQSIKSGNQSPMLIPSHSSLSGNIDISTLSSELNKTEYNLDTNDIEYKETLMPDSPHSITPNKQSLLLPVLSTSQMTPVEQFYANIPYSIESYFTLHLRIHRSSTYSTLHLLHQNHPEFTNMVMFLTDVSRYKQLHRLELFPNSRILWVKILIIYQKYLAKQISYYSNSLKSGTGSISNGIVGTTENALDPSFLSPVDSVAIDDTTGRNIVSIHILVQKQLLVHKSRYLSDYRIWNKSSKLSSHSTSTSTNNNMNDKISRIKRSQSAPPSQQSTSNPNLSFHNTPVRNLSSRNMGNDSTHTTDNIHSDSNDNSEESSCSIPADWKLSPTVLIATHKRVFSNIRRQIAGFDVKSMKLLSIDDNINDSISDTNNMSELSLSNHESSSIGRLLRNGSYQSSSNKYKNDNSNNNNSNSYDSGNNTNSTTSNQSTAVVAGSAMSMNMSTTMNPTSTSSTTNQSNGMFGWLWGQPSLTSNSLNSTNTTPESSSNSLGMKLNGFIPSDQYIRYEEIYNIHENLGHGIDNQSDSPVSISSTSFTTTSSSTASRNKGMLSKDINSLNSNLGNKPIYQIKDIDDLPPITLFDDIVTEVQNRIQQIFHLHLHLPFSIIVSVSLSIICQSKWFHNNNSFSN